MGSDTHSTIIDEASIYKTLEDAQKHEHAQVMDILAKAREMKGLNMDEIAVLMQISDPDLLGELFSTARWLKNEIYGTRLVIFAPMYISNLCRNECTYCAFRVRNKAIPRRSLTMDEIAHETLMLINQGHKRMLLVAGESYPRQGFQYVLDAIAKVYETKTDKGEIRRINVNIAPLEVEEFKQLHEAKIGTYQLFQETYHRDTYHRVHIAGPKADYDYRITAIDRAMEAGIDDVGVGVLFGLADWRFEILALMQHAQHLEKKFGVGPHTISVPRLEPATGSEISQHPPKPVSDLIFRKIVAILRIAVPYTGIIMSTRETANIRRETFALGVSQISAGSRTNPGGYGEDEGVAEAGEQFSLGDHRTVDEVIRDICELGYVPSFCTACYRLGRTGADFMDLAKPGDIKMHCDPNALSTLQEYLEDYGSPETREAGERVMQSTLENMTPEQRDRSEKLITRVKSGKRDVFC